MGGGGGKENDIRDSDEKSWDAGFSCKRSRNVGSGPLFQTRITMRLRLAMPRCISLSVSSFGINLMNVCHVL